jgi:hypothetical protein
VRTLAEKTRVATNDLLALINALLTGNDWLLIGKAVAALWVIGWVGRIITPMGLLYTGERMCVCFLLFAALNEFCLLSCKLPSGVNLCDCKLHHVPCVRLSSAETSRPCKILYSR